ncbi:MarR family winged helix-turn-helix transcriptional regulator [Chryseobacterium koreense]|uniref:MarR family winged helix-turn-helix transcriptional regulator n=1 Tax=Chryseobacterium koreense TaxID=232216 RepID=UPI0026F35063|nr:MarR family transcriptional regulator [Chryseobacterium koreense]
MNYRLIEGVIDLVQQFEVENKGANHYEVSVDGFKDWILNGSGTVSKEPEWEGKERGRSAESVINTLIVHLSRYAKSYSKSAILGSDFSTQDDFIFLINLNAFGAMSKMELIKKNVHEKPVGMQIINRLISLGWIEQRESTMDKRSKVISVSEKGKAALEKQMDKIRQATVVVAGNLSQSEKMQLIVLLQKLDHFHQKIYKKNKKTEFLLNEALNSI